MNKSNVTKWLRIIQKKNQTILPCSYFFLLLFYSKPPWMLKRMDGRMNEKKSLKFSEICKRNSCRGLNVQAPLETAKPSDFSMRSLALILPNSLLRTVGPTGHEGSAELQCCPLINNTNFLQCSRWFLYWKCHRVPLCWWVISLSTSLKSQVLLLFFYPYMDILHQVTSMRSAEGSNRWRDQLKQVANRCFVLFSDLLIKLYILIKSVPSFSAICVHSSSSALSISCFISFNTHWTLHDTNTHFYKVTRWLDIIFVSKWNQLQFRHVLDNS